MGKNLVYKIFTLALASLILLGSVMGVNPKPDSALAAANSITVYSWEDYIDEDLLVEIEEELANDGVSLNYIAFATCEEMYNELLKNPYGCDLICPSEYMIMKMRDEGLIKPFTVPQNWQDYGSPYIKDTFKKLGMNTEDGKTYAVGYMWGTMGLIYNMDKISAEDLNHWNAIWKSEYSKRVTIKDSVRDSYIMALGAVYQNELMTLDKTAPDYSDRVFEIFNRTDATTLGLVEHSLKDLKGNLYGFEVDGGKNDMINGTIDINFAWSGDAVYTMDEGDAAGKAFGYVVPEEGSNVWFDGWVMPTHANEQMASRFIDLVSSPQSAIRNMDYIGYVSCVAGEEVFEYVKSKSDDEGEYTINLGYFFGGDNSVYSVKTDSPYRQLATQYPDYDIIRRCAVMDNFDKDTLLEINEMWNRVKLITFPTWLIILIVVCVVLIVASYLIIKFKDKLFRFNKRSRRGYKVISKEEYVKE